MRFYLPFLVLLLFYSVLQAQKKYSVTGKILNAQTKSPILNLKIELEAAYSISKINQKGEFYLETSLSGDYILYVFAPNFIEKRIPVILDRDSLYLGVVYLEKDIIYEKSANLVSLTNVNLSDEDGETMTSSLLQATRDIFLRRAAFDFGQAFFRVRGYDSENGIVLINGIPMNKLFDGRPQWNNWGGLNDVTRNQEFTQGLQFSTANFGGILGTTNIDMRPSSFRPGIRLSTSYSNRTYAGRIMVSYNSGIQKNGLSYSVSGSRRWAKEGYIQGTLYDAYSFFGALEYKLNSKHSFSALGIIASNRRGRSSAITEETYNLAGKRYNPYWGIQNGEIRNSRERKITAAILMCNYFFKASNIMVNTGAAYQFGTVSKSRLGYYNAPNPDPTYYRYMPSFYINSPIGANFENASLAKEGFIKNPQLNWDNLYVANRFPKAAYILYDDVVKDRSLRLNSVANIKTNDAFSIDLGITYTNLDTANYAKIRDLLNAEYHKDSDAFSNTVNDLGGIIFKKEKETFNYHYKVNAEKLVVFTQFRFDLKKCKGFLSGMYTTVDYQRDGVFQNERFIRNSLGKSEKLKFMDYSVKTGISYKITGRHWIQINGAYLNKPPSIQNTFINPRENNGIVSNLQNENIATLDVGYFLRSPKFMGRITGFYTRFKDVADINFFFVDLGVGSDFVQEVVTALDKLHFGTEIGLEYKASSSVKLSTVVALGNYEYTSNPNVIINFDTAGAEEDIIDPQGNIDLGEASIKGYKLARGPQKAYSLGIEYRAPKYWWVSGTVNFLGNNYASISTILRTKSFYLNPETNMPFPNATEENVHRLLAQKKLDNFYLLNLVGGKSWRINKKYVSVFASINNVFDTVFRTGGYEQSRNGNYGQLFHDNLSGRPSFAPKYWYGYGRTYFINVIC